MEIHIVKEIDPRIGTLSAPAKISARVIKENLVNISMGLKYPTKDIDTGASINRNIVFSTNDKALAFLREKELRKTFRAIDFSKLSIEKMEKILSIIEN